MRAFLPVSVILLLAGAAACDDDSPTSSAGTMCNALADQAVKCDKKFKKDKRKALVASCIAMAENDKEYRERIVGLYECTKKDSCEAADECRKAAREKRQINKILTGKPADIEGDCRYLNKKLINPEVKTACGKAVVYALEQAAKGGEEVKCWRLKDLTKRYGSDAQQKQAEKVCAAAKSKALLDELNKLKDKPDELAKQCDYARPDRLSAEVKKLCAGALDGLLHIVARSTASGEKSDYRTCYRAKSLAKKLGTKQDEVKKACDANELAAQVKRAMGRVKEYIAAKQKHLPYDCRYTLRKLDKIPDSEWKTKTRDALIKACYVDLAVVVIENTAPRRYCAFGVRSVIKAAAEHKLFAKYPQLLEALNKHPKCAAEIQKAQRP